MPSFVWKIGTMSKLASGSGVSAKTGLRGDAPSAENKNSLSWISPLITTELELPEDALALVAAAANKGPHVYCVRRESCTTSRAFRVSS